MARNQPYQVQETDRDLLTLAEKLKLDYPTLKAANPSITSISPGQFINRPLQQTSPVLSNSSATGVEEIQTGSFLGGNNLAPTVNTGYYPNNPNAPAPTPPPPPTYGPMGNLRPPIQPANPYTVNPYLDPKNEARVYVLQNQLLTAQSFADLPPLVSSADAAHAGFSPAKMLQAGYVLKNGNWVKGTGPGGGPVSDNNWETNDALHLITMNRNAKNRRNRFQTTLKWAKNAWKRKKLAAKGHGRTEPAAEIRMDTPSTTLDLILGS
jgi:hypothetical protein